MGSSTGCSVDICSTFMGCRATADLTMFCTMGYRGISNSEYEAPSAPPSSLTLMCAELIHICSLLSQHFLPFLKYITKEVLRMLLMGSVWAAVGLLELSLSNTVAASGVFLQMPSPQPVLLSKHCHINQIHSVYSSPYVEISACLYIKELKTL